jgi:hypothetical protein
MNMNKREVVWLIVKLIGVYFIYLSVVSAFSLISSVSTLYSVSSQISTTKPDANSTASPVITPDSLPGRPPVPSNKTNEKPVVDASQKKLADEAIKNVLFYVFLTILYGATGFYLIKDGRILFILLNQEERIVTETKEINSLGIFDEKK